MDGQIHCIQSSLRVSNSILKGDLDIKNKQEVTFLANVEKFKSRTVAKFCIHESRVGSKLGQHAI